MLAYADDLALLAKTKQKTKAPKRFKVYVEQKTLEMNVRKNKVLKIKGR